MGGGITNSSKLVWILDNRRRQVTHCIITVDMLHDKGLFMLIYI